VVNGCDGLPTADANVQKAVSLKHNMGGMGFDNLNRTLVEDLLNVHSEELTDGNLWELPNKMSEDKDDKERKLNNDNLQMADLLVKTDPFMERSLKFKTGLEGLLVVLQRST
jgi:hypothetical protein